MVGDALIVDAVRSPIGKRNGTLASLRADELAAQVLDALVQRVGIDPGEVEDVQMGCVTQVGEQALNVARVASLTAGWPETVCGATTDRQCGSSMQAAFTAASTIQAGHLDVVVAAGVESMSRVPMGSNMGEAGWGGFSPKLYERWEIVPQGISAEVIAEEWGMSREALDAYSYESHRRAITAMDEGRFDREIVAVEVSNPHAGVLFGVDETPRRDEGGELVARHVLDRADARADPRGAVRVHVKSDHGQARLGEGHGQGQADVAEPDDTDGGVASLQPLLELLRHLPHGGAQWSRPSASRMARAVTSISASVSSGKHGSDSTSAEARAAWGKARSASGRANMGWAGMAIG